MANIVLSNNVSKLKDHSPAPSLSLSLYIYIYIYIYMRRPEYRTGLDSEFKKKLKMQELKYIK